MIQTDAGVLVAVRYHLSTFESMKVKIEQVTSSHIHRYSNVAPRDVGLWVYIIDGRAYGFSITEQGAIEKAELAVGSVDCQDATL